MRYVTHALLILTLGLALPAVVDAQSKSPQVILDGQRFGAGEEVHVRVAASGVALESSAWVGIIPSLTPHGSEAVNDEHDLDFRYLRDNHDREYWFTAPMRPGRYDIRLHDRDDGGRELHSVSFEVVANPKQRRGQKASVKLDGKTYKAGTWIRIELTAPADWADDAWVGVIPAEVPHGSEAVNDEHDVSYRHLGGLRWGVIRLQAPKEPGRYDVRLHDTDQGGKEAASVGFVVQ